MSRERKRESKEERLLFRGPGFCCQTSDEGEYEHNRRKTLEMLWGSQPKEAHIDKITMYLGILMFFSHPNSNHLYLEVSLTDMIQVNVLKCSQIGKTLQFYLNVGIFMVIAVFKVKASQAQTGTPKESSQIEMWAWPLLLWKYKKRCIPRLSGWVDDSQRIDFGKCWAQILM